MHGFAIPAAPARSERSEAHGIARSTAQHAEKLHGPNCQSADVYLRASHPIQKCTERQQNTALHHMHHAHDLFGRTTTTSAAVQQLFHTIVAVCSVTQYAVVVVIIAARDFRHRNFGIDVVGATGAILVVFGAIPSRSVCIDNVTVLELTMMIRLLSLSRFVAVVSTAHRFGCQGGYEHHNPGNVFHCAHIVEQEKTQKQRRGLACSAGNGHGESTKLFGNGGRTRRTKKSHGTEQDHDKTLARNRVSAFLQRSAV